MRHDWLSVGIILAALLATPLTQHDTEARADQVPINPPVGVRRPAIQDPVRVPAPAGTCSGFIQDLWAYVNANRGANTGAHRIGAKMAVVKIRDRDGSVYPWGHGSYSEGAFGWSGANLTGRFQVLFSDRRTGDGGRFDRTRADIQDVTLYADGRVEIVLRSWGNPVVPLESLQCYPDGFLTGILREVNGVALVSFVLRKEVITPDSHPAALWP